MDEKPARKWPHEGGHVTGSLASNSPVTDGERLYVFFGSRGLHCLDLKGGVPRVLGWREETKRLTRLTRQVFWTYAGYIWGTNVCMGALSAFAPTLILDGSPLARAVSAYIALYWGARLLLSSSATTARS